VQSAAQGETERSPDLLSEARGSTKQSNERQMAANGVSSALTGGLLVRIQPEVEPWGLENAEAL
jgi:hypothetical protein